MCIHFVNIIFSAFLENKTKIAGIGLGNSILCIFSIYGSIHSCCLAGSAANLARHLCCISALLEALREAYLSSVILSVSCCKELGGSRVYPIILYSQNYFNHSVAVYARMLRIL